MSQLNTEIFIQKARKVYGDKYDYSKVKYINSRTKVCIICKAHGEFWMTPNNHLSGKGCKLCGIESIKNKQRLTTSEFIQKARKIHGDRYDYSKVEYVNNNTKVCIICKAHGEFWQTPNKHLSGENCPKCSGGIKSSTEEFIQKARKIYGDKYDYSKVNYVNAITKVCIICKTHGEFWMTPNNHLRGKECPKCNQSKLENDIMINFQKIESQKEFDWLIYQRHMKLDFYIPDKNIAIECQGEQHFKPMDIFGGDDEYIKNVYRDKLKYDLCRRHNVKIVYYFPKIFLKYDNHFYDDKKYFHTIGDLKKYIDSL